MKCVGSEMINSHASVAVCSLYVHISHENHEVCPLITPRIKAEFRTSILYSHQNCSRSTPPCYNTRLVQNIVFYCTTHLTSGHIKCSFSFVKAKTQQETAHIYHRPHLLYGGHLKESQIYVNFRCVISLGRSDLCTWNTSLWGRMEEREKNERPGKWVVTLQWKQLRGCWNGQKWPDNHTPESKMGLILATHLLTYSWPQRIPNKEV